MTTLDNCLKTLDGALRSFAGTVSAKRDNPGADESSNLTDEERRHAAGLMRVNHCGEICAQALYQGQACTAQSETLREALDAAARDEEDHLAWCQERLTELESRPSILGPAFYAASFALGAATGLLGDRVSLGFVKATEDEVREHLDRHIERLPEADGKSRAILAAMRSDEARHGEDAARAGGVSYPLAVRNAMALASKVMTLSTYRM